MKTFKRIVSLNIAFVMSLWMLTIVSLGLSKNAALASTISEPEEENETETIQISMSLTAQEAGEFGIEEGEYLRIMGKAQPMVYKVEAVAISNEEAPQSAGINFLPYAVGLLAAVSGSLFYVLKKIRKQ